MHYQLFARYWSVPALLQSRPFTQSTCRLLEPLQQDLHLRSARWTVQRPNSTLSVLGSSPVSTRPGPFASSRYLASRALNVCTAFLFILLPRLTPHLSQIIPHLRRCRRFRRRPRPTLWCIRQTPTILRCCRRSDTWRLYGVDKSPRGHRGLEGTQIQEVRHSS